MHGPTWIFRANLIPFSLKPAVRPEREYLPTTERSLLWDDPKTGKMWKLIALERRANRFHPNGSQVRKTPSWPRS